jgi:hypothetical protein
MSSPTVEVLSTVAADQISEAVNGAPRLSVTVASEP